MLKRVCVFCGSSLGRRASYREAAARLGRALAQAGIGVVYGGGNVGLMGVLADAAIGQGGEVIGVIPEQMVNRELAHRGVTELRIVTSMHERKALMADLSDAFIALPGGYGTFEELCEAITWSQLGIHAKPCALLNVDRYYDHLLGLFDLAVEEGFVRPEMRRLVLVDSDVEALLGRLATWQPPAGERRMASDGR